MKLLYVQPDTKNRHHAKFIPITEVLGLDEPQRQAAIVIREFPDKPARIILASFYAITATTGDMYEPFDTAMKELDRQALFRIYHPFELDSLFDYFGGAQNVPNPLPFEPSPTTKMYVDMAACVGDRTVMTVRPMRDPAESIIMLDVPQFAPDFQPPLKLGTRKPVHELHKPDLGGRD